MKCPRCLAVALETDTVCVGCHQPLIRDDPTKGKRFTMTLPAKLALAFAALGAGIGPVVGYAFFASPQVKPGTGGMSWPLFLVIGAGIGALVGYFLGVLVFEKDRPNAGPPLPPLAPEAEAAEPEAAEPEAAEPAA